MLLYAVVLGGGWKHGTLNVLGWQKRVLGCHYLLCVAADVSWASQAAVPRCRTLYIRTSHAMMSQFKHALTRWRIYPPIVDGVVLYVYQKRPYSREVASAGLETLVRMWSCAGRSLDRFKWSVTKGRQIWDGRLRRVARTSWVHQTGRSL